MSQLYRVGLQNFRVFEEMTEFELAPLTILTGANSSGKSSLFKGLLLIGNNVENNSFYKLDFTGTQHNLGSFKDALNKQVKDEDIRLRFYLNYPFRRTRKYPISTGRKLSNLYMSFELKTDSNIILEVGYKEDNNNGRLTSLIIYIQNSLNKTTLVFAQIDEDEKYHSFSINMKWFADNYETIQSYRRGSNYANKFHIDNDFSKNDLKNFKIPKSKNIDKNSRNYHRFSFQEGNDSIEYILSYFYFNSDSFISKQDLKESGFKNAKSVYSSNEIGDIISFIRYNILEETGYHLENTEYVEAVRAKSRRIYTHDSQSTLFDELLLDYNSVQLNNQASHFLKKWIKKFEIADDIKFESVNGVATMVKFIKSGIEYPLADLGYGVTQYLPLLLKIALQITTKDSDRRVKPSYINSERPLKKIIIIEEPETNLHPKLQSRLADMFLDALVNFEIRFIIETHSEYFIRRLQILTAEKVAFPNQIALYYFYEPRKIPQGKKQIEKINILSNGNLDNDFGEGFFDEATKMKFDLLKLKTKDK